MFQISILVLSLFINSVISAVGSNFEYFHHKVSSCNIGDVVRNECNKCMCTSKGIYECKPIECNKRKGLEEVDLDNKQICIPNQLYMRKLITCICTKDGKWPHKSCQETFLALPPSSVEVHKCEPNSYAIIDCNVCRCGPDGEYISSRCTKNVCDEDIFRRFDVDPKKSSVFSKCMPKHWYSFAPCQFCYCINENKLVCTTGHQTDQQLAVGKYHMEVCGTEMIAEALELIPPGVSAPPLPLRQYEANNNYPSNNYVPNANAAPATNTKYIPKKTPESIESSSGEDGNVADSGRDYVASDEVEKKPKQQNVVKVVSENIVTTARSPVKVKSQKEAASEVSESESEDEDSKEDSKDVISNEINIDIKSKNPNINAVKKHPSNGLKIAKKPSGPLGPPGPPGPPGEPVKPNHDVEYTGNTLKIDVPSVLNKMIEMALRKSMVQLSKETSCKPGTTSVNACNVCFCLKNGKLLCTANKC